MIALLVVELGRGRDPEHPGHREAPDVGVERGDVLAPLGQRDRQVRGDRGLPHAALARGDREHPRRGVRKGFSPGMRPSCLPGVPWRISTTDVGRIPDMPAEPALDADEFSAAVSAVTSAFGDPTRRDIYLAIRETPDGVTATEVAERFALHPNVARHHLEKLSAGGYVTVDVGSGRGRTRRRPAVEALPGVRAGQPRSTSRPAATTSSPRCSPARSTCCRPTRPRRWPRRSASSTAALSRRAWRRAKATGR